jgi:ribosomal protein S27AE
MGEILIHRFECSNCGAVSHADRVIGCYRCGKEMEVSEKNVDTIEVEDY